MKLVVDSNTLISGSLWQGPPARLISAVLAGQAADVSLPADAPGIAGNLPAAKILAPPYRPGRNAGFHGGTFSRRLLLVPPPELRDADDAHVLACAVSAQADAIVTGDKDLLELRSFAGIPIINAADALTRLGLS